MKNFIDIAESKADIERKKAELRQQFDFVDTDIREVVVLLNIHGFKTFQSCQGGEGHCYQDPTVEFEGTEFDLIRAFDLLLSYNFNAFEAQRVFIKNDVEPFNLGTSKEIWEHPFNRITLLVSDDTGSILLS